MTLSRSVCVAGGYCPFTSVGPDPVQAVTEDECRPKCLKIHPKQTGRIPKIRRRTGGFVRSSPRGSLRCTFRCGPCSLQAAVRRARHLLRVHEAPVWALLCTWAWSESGGALCCDTRPPPPPTIEVRP